MSWRSRCWALLLAVPLLHPLATETVLSLSGRGELLVTVGALLACLACAAPRFNHWSVLALALGVVLALGGKQSGVVVLLLVPFTLWHAGGTPRWASCLVTLACAGLVLVGVDWYGGLRAIANAESGSFEITWDRWLLAQGGAVAYWLQAMAWPPLLTPDADIDRVSLAVRGVGVLLVVVSGWLAWRRRLYGAGLFAVALLPRLFVQTPGSYLNAHQFYLPWMGVVLVLAAVGGRYLGEPEPA
jgi:hypothetical protein